MSHPNSLVSATDTVTDALIWFATLLDGHGASCVCSACQALVAGQAAMERLALLAVLLDARATEEARRRIPRKDVSKKGTPCLSLDVP